jgi:hypothetical protein
MKTILGSSRCRYLVRASILLIMVALIGGMAGCGGGSGTPLQNTLTIYGTQGGIIDTPGIETYVYDNGDVVPLIATPDTSNHYQFAEWTGDVGTVADVNAAATNIAVDGNYTVTANFELDPGWYTLTISLTSGGNVTTPGIDTYVYGNSTVVPLVAVPDTSNHYHFAGWTGDVGTVADVNAAATNITMDNNYCVKANFELDPGWYTLTIFHTGGGSVTIPGEGTYVYGNSTVVPLVAVPDTGYQLTQWTGDVGTIADVNAPSTNITMNGNYSISANFGRPILLQENFEDGQDQGWSYSGGGIVNITDDAGNNVYNLQGLHDGTRGYSAETFYDGSANWSDYEVSFDIKLLEDDCGSFFYFRFSDWRNCYCLATRTGTGSWGSMGGLELYQYVNGEVIDNMNGSYNRWLAPPLEVGTWYHIDVFATGDRIQIYLNGELEFDRTGALLSEGKIGFEARPWPGNPADWPVWSGGHLASYGHINIDNIVVSTTYLPIINPNFGPILLQENFEDGQDQGWSYSGGGIVNITDDAGNNVYNLQGLHDGTRGYSAETFYDGSAGWSDYEVSFDIKLLEDDCASDFYFRFSDSLNYYRLAIRTGYGSWGYGGRLELYQYVNGQVIDDMNGYYNRWIGAPVQVGTWYHIKVSAIGGRIQIYFNGELKFDRTGARLSKGKICFDGEPWPGNPADWPVWSGGKLASYGHIHIDNIVVTGASS